MKRYRDAVELARALVVGLDVGGAVLLWNREAERVTGLARDEVMGKPFAEALPVGALDDEDAGEARAAIARLLAGAVGGEPAPADTIETVLRTRGGKRRDVRWQIARAPAGEPAGEVVLVATGRDVTGENA